LIYGQLPTLLRRPIHLFTTLTDTGQANLGLNFGYRTSKQLKTAIRNRKHLRSMTQPFTGRKERMVFRIGANVWVSYISSWATGTSGGRCSGSITTLGAGHRQLPKIFFSLIYGQLPTLLRRPYPSFHHPDRYWSG